MRDTRVVLDTDPTRSGEPEKAVLPYYMRTWMFVQRARRSVAMHGLLLHTYVATPHRSVEELAKIFYNHFDRRLSTVDA